MIEYSLEFKSNHKTAYLAEEFERLTKDAQEAIVAAGDDSEMISMAQEDIQKIDTRKKEILNEIEKKNHFLKLLCLNYELELEEMKRLYLPKSSRICTLNLQRENSFVYVL
jgi:predicted PilT family ATPase